MDKGKSFEISRHLVYEAYKRVKANKGAGGIDGIDFEEYEENLKGNLYKLWNRMSSGSYFPKAVRGVEIPKKNGKKRLLGIPTIEDRVAQMIVRMGLEEKVEPIFCDNSYGYRPKRSAIDAIKVTRERCWKFPWVLEFDIVGLFDNIDHELMMKLVKLHTKNKWVMLYTERFLKAPMQLPNGQTVERKTGTPQGGVISPVLANLFLHYAFDRWMEKKLPKNSWVRYADDGVIHCQTKEEAEQILKDLKERMNICKLEIHSEKTKIVYCRSNKFPDRHENESFDFLGYTFRTRHIKNTYGNYSNAFTPAVSRGAEQSLRDKIKKIRQKYRLLQIDFLAELMNPIIRGWMNYFTKFNESYAKNIVKYVNFALVKWIGKKYKIASRNILQATRKLAIIAKANPDMFYHWRMGLKPTIG